MKTCNKCRKYKALTDFYKEGKYYRSECKCCRLASLKTPEARKKNAERMRKCCAKMTAEEKAKKAENRKAWGAKNKAYLRVYALNRVYGLSAVEFDTMFAQQDGKCAICGNSPGGSRPLAVDHCHKTGKVRGLLCYKCNRSVSLVDDPELHHKSINYVNKYKEAA